MLNQHEAGSSGNSQTERNFCTSNTWHSQSSLITLYIALLPFLACGTLFLGLNHWLTYGVVIVYLGCHLILLNPSAPSTRQRLSQSVRDNGLYTALIVWMCISFMAKVLTGIVTFDFEYLARVGGYIFAGASSVFVLPLLIEQTKNFNTLAAGICAVMVLLTILSLSTNSQSNAFSCLTSGKPSDGKGIFLPNHLAFLNLIAFSLALYLVTQVRKITWRALLYAVLVVTMVGIIMSSSRTVYVMTLIAPLLFFLLIGAYRTFALSIALIGITFFLFFVFGNGSRWISCELWDVHLGLTSTSAPLFNRTHLWKAGLVHLAESPLIGFGFFQEKLALFFQHVVPGSGSSDNVFLDTALLHGLPATLLLLAFIGLSFLRLLKNYDRHHDLCARHSIIIVICFLSVVFMSMEIISIVYPHFISIVMGLFYGLANIRRPTTPEHQSGQ